MARFVFQLQGVLRQREQAEDQRQRELATVRAELAVLEAELHEMDEASKASTGDVRDNRLVGRLDLPFLAAHRRYTLALQRKAVALAQEMAAVQQRVETARLALIEAARGRKILEKLRDDRRAQWASDLARKETADLDEVGAQIGYRNGAVHRGDDADKDESFDPSQTDESKEPGSADPSATKEQA